jgi:predicted RNA-binding protein associated with RNAse of E/G family
MDCVMNFVALTIIADIDNLYFDSLRYGKMTKDQVDKALTIDSKE